VNRSDFVDAANREKVRPDAYSFEGGFPSERYVLDVEPGGWVVYYSERGERVGESHFETEDEACSELLMRLLKDRSTRKSI
jgi:hypothetical protein